jgi:hypothetical protein
MLAGGKELLSWPGGRSFGTQDPNDLLGGGLSGSATLPTFSSAFSTATTSLFEFLGACPGEASESDSEVRAPQLKRILEDSLARECPVSVPDIAAQNGYANPGCIRLEFTRSLPSHRQEDCSTEESRNERK